MIRSPNSCIREEKESLLIVGEGKREEVFLKYVNDVYSCRNGTVFDIKNGSGGSPETIINRAKNIALDGEYKDVIAVIDSDKLTEEAENLARSEDVELIVNKPCLEGLFLQIKEKRGKPYSKYKNCKKEFNDEYLRSGEIDFDIESCKRIFPKNELDKMCKKIIQLNKIVNIIKRGEL